MTKIDWVWFIRPDRLDFFKDRFADEFDFGVLHNECLEVFANTNSICQYDVIAVIPKRHVDQFLVEQLLTYSTSLKIAHKSFVQSKMTISESTMPLSDKFNANLSSVIKAEERLNRNLSYFKIYDDYSFFEIAITKSGVTFFYPFADITAIESAFKIYFSGEICG